ncbi:MAG TPA: TonB-dependent receptor plug domain-containing protein, partial [Vicinamibacterales bacterium]
MAIAIAHPAIAQDASSASESQAAESQADEAAARAGVGDIIVTARRQSESVQKVPISISAFSSELLEAKNLDDIADVARNVPNVQLDAVSSESGAASTQIAIRGIGQTDYVLTVEPAVGVYLDGVYVGKSLGSLLDTVDVERVEVLRGPQGTLFGKNTLAGAISVITKRPSQDLEYQFEASTGSFRRLDARASISGPISDWLRYRVSASYRSANGFLERAMLDGRRTGVFQGDINRFNARAKFEADVTPDVLATLTLDM